MLRNKKGDLEIKYVVGLVIAIVVVYVVIIFFMGGVQGLGAKFGLLSEKSSKPVDSFDLGKLISDSGSTGSSATSGTGASGSGGTTGSSGSGDTRTPVDPPAGGCTTTTKTTETCANRQGECINLVKQKCNGARIMSGDAYTCPGDKPSCCCAT